MAICLSWRFVFAICISLLLDFTKSTATTTPVTTLPSTKFVTTVPIPPGGCFVNNRVYLNGEKISTDSGGCGGTMCSQGSVIYWDAWCMFYSSTPDTTIPPSTTPPTTAPLFPPGGCFYNNKAYHDGETILKEECGGIKCLKGEIAYWDDWCMFYSSTPDTTTTTPPPTTTPLPLTTTPRVSPGGCLYDNKVYSDGDTIRKEKCSGMMCLQGQITYWDDWCMFYSSTPDTTTSPPPTTTPLTTTPRIPPGACFYDNKVYIDDDIFDIDTNGCHGYECHYGVVRPWQKRCFISEAKCNDTLVNVTGECCPVCRDTIQQESTTTTITTTGVITTNIGCIIRNTVYSLNSRTNTDPCNKCYCTTNGEVCRRTICEDVTDCVFKYRLKGECCLFAVPLIAYISH